MLAELVILAAGAAPLGHDAAPAVQPQAELADAAPAQDLPYVLSLHLHLGLGLLAYSASFGGLWWPYKHVGFGPQATAAGVSKLFHGHSEGYGAGWLLGLRTSASGSYGLLLLGMGVAHSSTTTTDGLCGVLDLNGTSDCKPPQTHSGASGLITGGVGWLWHPGGIELGPVLRVDATSDFAAVTLNFAVGIAAR
jgi:hypothetical protein